ncbi:MAG: DUF998 domain-containing protein [Candidatus Methanofastidiosia archaeon]
MIKMARCRICCLDPNAKLQVAGLCGILAPIVAFISISLAIFYSPWFSWTENWLSDLGVNGRASLLFNGGLVITGILSVIFGSGLRARFASMSSGNLGSIVFILGALSLCGVGIFPETRGELHFYVSVSFFVLVSLAMFFIGASMVKLSEKASGFFAIVLGIAAVVAWIVSWPGNGGAIPETVSAAAMSVFSILYGGRLFKYP